MLYLKRFTCSIDDRPWVVIHGGPYSIAVLDGKRAGHTRSKLRLDHKPAYKDGHARSYPGVP